MFKAVLRVDKNKTNPRLPSFRVVKALNKIDQISHEVARKKDSWKSEQLLGEITGGSDQVANINQ